MSGKPLDCLIIGAGPAGLTAAIYLARFHLSVLVLHDDASRAALIPTSHNLAGFPDGIGGAELLARMSAQALQFGARIAVARASSVTRVSGGFIVGAGRQSLAARAVLLATGVADRKLPMAEAQHAEALRRGLLRYCPICDGFEVTDRKIAVIGTGGHALREAEFLRSYSADVTLVAPDGPHALDAAKRAQAGEWGIGLRDGPCLGAIIAGARIGIGFASGPEYFDTVYPALGSDIRSELAAAAGVRLSPDGCIATGRHQETDVPGIYAAGDVVLGLDQIGNAMGQAGVAATAIRNALCEASPLRR